MKTIGIGIVGWGFMGKTHAYGYKNMRLFYDDLPFETKLIGVANRSEEKLSLATRDAGFLYGTTDYRELLADPNIHAIHICTPNSSHSEIAIAAAKAGKHVYCDKPIAMNKTQAEEMLKAAIDNNIIHRVAFHNRFYPSTLKAKQLMDDGLIGEITTFRGMYYHSGSISPDKSAAWRYRKSDSGGGALFDLGSHVIDLLTWLMGDCKKVFCATKILHNKRPNGNGGVFKVDVEDHASLILWLNDKTFGTVEATKIASGSEDEMIVEIHGTKGAIKFNSNNINQIGYYDAKQDDGFTYINCSSRYNEPGGHFPSSKSGVGWLRGHVASVYDFANSIYSGTQSKPSFYKALINQKILDAAYESEIGRASCRERV